MTTLPPYIDTLMARGRAFLDGATPILGGAMTWVSDRTLVAAISNAGGFGVIACGAMTPDLLRAEIQATRALTTRPFGVNLITLHPDLAQLINVVIEERITHVILAGGIPNGESIAALKTAGIKVICFAPALPLAKRLVRLGADALIVEGSEAGGHIGPVSTSILVQEIIPHVPDVPIFVAGGIGRGDVMLAYLEMGAAGCQLGTKFVCAHESRAHPKFKAAFIKAAARDAVVSASLDPRFPVIPVRAIANEGTRQFAAFQREMIEAVDQGDLDLKEAQLKIEHYWAGALRRAVIDGDIETGSIMAGQTVGLVTAESSTQEIIDTLILEAFDALSRRA